MFNLILVVSSVNTLRLLLKAVRSFNEVKMTQYCCWCSFYSFPRSSLNNNCYCVYFMLTVHFKVFTTTVQVFAAAVQV